MNKKSKFLIGGMLFGGAAFAAFKKLDAKKQKQLINKTTSLAKKLKKQAIGYTLYLDDEVSDMKDNFNDKARNAKNKAEDIADQTTDQVKNTAGQVGKKVSNVYFKASQNKSDNNDNSTQFHTATDHLRSALNDSNQNDIVINDNSISSSNEPTLVFYPDGSSKRK